MAREQLEASLLKKLNEGQFDGQVGGDFPAPGAICRRLIRNGVPQYITIRPNEPEVVDKKHESMEEKLKFLRSAGWMMSDPDAQLYSRLYKREDRQKNK